MTFAYKEMTQAPEPVTEPKRQMKIAVVAQSDGCADAIKGAMNLDGSVDVLVIDAALSSARVKLACQAHKVEFVIFEVDEVEPDLEAMADIRAQADEAPHFIAMTRDDLSVAEQREYREAGVQEVIPALKTVQAPVEEAAPAVERRLHLSDPESPVDEGAGDKLADVSVILRARGGAGATTVAVNLAAGLAKSGSVALVDLDIQNGSVGILMDLKDSAAFSALIKSRATPDARFLDQAMVTHSSGVHVLSAPDVFAPLTALTPGMVADLMAALIARYDYVVMDMPQAVVDWMDPVLSEASRAFIVTDTAVPSIKRARRLIGLIGEDHMTLPVKIVVNKEKRPMMQSASHKEAAKVLDRPLDVWIPQDDKAARNAIDVGEPMLIGSKRSPASKGFAALAETVRKAAEADKEAR